MPGSRRLVLYGDPRLRVVCRPVAPGEPGLAALVDAMLAVMRCHGGVGLAAPQVGEPLRVVVADPEGGRPRVLINPEVVATGDRRGAFTEGCLSFPGVYRPVVRPLAAEFRYLTPAGRRRRLADDGLLARILLHEIDHLDGRLLVDHLPWWRRWDIPWRRLVWQRRRRRGEE